MRKEPNCKIEAYRTGGPVHANSGQFRIPYKMGRAHGTVLTVQSSDGGGWDHVSVSLPHRCPTWEEMEYVRTLFFRDDECVMQLSVPRTDHVNIHNYCLHWWRPQTAEEIAAVRRQWQQAGEGPVPDWPVPGPIPRPPQELV